MAFIILTQNRIGIAVLIIEERTPAGLLHREGAVGIALPVHQIPQKLLFLPAEHNGVALPEDLSVTGQYDLTPRAATYSLYVVYGLGNFHQYVYLIVFYKFLNIM